jgi:hypothetical protein
LRLGALGRSGGERRSLGWLVAVAWGLAAWGTRGRCRDRASPPRGLAVARRLAGRSRGRQFGTWLPARAGDLARARPRDGASRDGSMPRSIQMRRQARAQGQAPAGRTDGFGDLGLGFGGTSSIYMMLNGPNNIWAGGLYLYIGLGFKNPWVCGHGYINPRPIPTNPLGPIFNPLIDPWV